MLSRLRILNLVVIAGMVVSLTGCPWSEWVSVTQRPAVYYEQTGRLACGWYDIAKRTPAVATNCPQPVNYIKAHEEAHGIIVNIGCFLGPSLMDQERAADVLAYIRTGIVGPYWPNGIDDASLLAGRTALERAGIEP